MPFEHYFSGENPEKATELRRASTFHYEMQLVNMNFDHLKNYSHLCLNSALNILKYM